MNRKKVYLRIEELIKNLRSQRIKEAARQAGDLKAWTRQRKMPLSDILICTLAKKGLSAVMEIRQYFQTVKRVEQTVSKQDYFKQRQKLNPEVFRMLNSDYLKGFYAGQEPQTWNGYLVMATDGSRGEIPNSEENRHIYGVSRNNSGDTVARVCISALRDVFNRFIADISIGRNYASEIEGAKAHITALKEITGERPVLIMFDRNYASLEFMDFLEQNGIKYLIRLHASDYKAEVEAMEGADGEVELNYKAGRLRIIKQKSPRRAAELKEKQSACVRIIKTVFANGDKANFITNLREGSGRDILRLYKKRWSIEKKFHTLKNKLKFESVAGKASIYVKQDFFAQMLVFNITQDLITAAERRVAKKAKKKRLKYEMRINENIAIGLLKEKFIRLMVEEEDSLKEAMFRCLIADMERYIVPVRELKSSPRKRKYYNKYKCNQKPSF